jgi:hypothetical protein
MKSGRHAVRSNRRASIPGHGSADRRKVARIRWVTAGLAVVLLGLALTLTVARLGQVPPAHASQTANYLVTFYGPADNSPPGAQIAYPRSQGNPTVHDSAGGTGTYSDPVTFATDQAELPVGTRIYLPYLHRYFVMEDDCAECDQDWTGSGPDGGPGLLHVDLWIGGQGALNSQDVTRCEDSLTRTTAQVIVDPPADQPVDTTPLFNSADDSCYNPGSFQPGSSNQQTTPTPAVTLEPTPSPTAAPVQEPSQTPPPDMVTFTAMTGYGCQATTTATFAEHGWWSQGLDGFIRVPSGGPLASGCNGSFDAMPMSGSATSDDPDNYAWWNFGTSPVTNGHCQVSVYVPDDSNPQHAGGHPAVYQVYGSTAVSGTPLGSFAIDQLANRGQWVSGGNWPVTSGTLTVKVDSRGIDWNNSGPDYAHIAISAVRVSCSR